MQHDHRNLSTTSSWSLALTTALSTSMMSAHLPGIQKTNFTKEEREIFTKSTPKHNASVMKTTIRYLPWRICSIKRPRVKRSQWLKMIKMIRWQGEQESECSRPELVVAIPIKQLPTPLLKVNRIAKMEILHPSSWDLTSTDKAQGTNTLTLFQ